MLPFKQVEPKNSIKLYRQTIIPFSLIDMILLQVVSIWTNKGVVDTTTHVATVAATTSNAPN